MKKMFIDARYKGDLEKLEGAEALPGEIELFSSIQYLDLLPKARRLLEIGGRKVNVQKQGSLHPGQILGCSMPTVKGEAAVYIGDGLFHPMALADSGKPIYLLSPATGRITLKEFAGQLERWKKAALARFYKSDRVGILVSTKKGQNRMVQALELRRLMAATGKRGYIFLSDNIDFGQLENFNFIGCWVNTACPRIAIDDHEKFKVPVINIADVLPILQAEKR
jgi:2-(3-amino-3-carboxypropyl)histidine synthase